MRWHTKNEEKKYFFYEKSDQSLKASQKFQRQCLGMEYTTNFVFYLIEKKIANKKVPRMSFS